MIKSPVEHSTMCIYSVSELTLKIKTLLEENFPIVWINGEISNFSRPVSGHYYFTLKDSGAQISAVMFQGQNRRLQFVPENGMKITALGRIGVYEPRGTYQIIVEHLDPKGLGALQVAFEQLKAKLETEGLFDSRHKKSIPAFPNRIALITSRTGAVVHDFIQVASRRFPGVPITLFPVAVQGADAAMEIVQAVHSANEIKRFDVIIIARGGGSLEVLQAFNTETMARAVFDSTIPVVSAIGHETDFTILDFVADLRAPTPSAAAELVLPDRRELKKELAARQQLLRIHFRQLLAKNRQQVERVSGRLVHPRRKIQDYRLRLDELLSRMTRALDYRLDQIQDRVAFMNKSLYANLLGPALKNYRERVRDKQYNLKRNIRSILDRKRSRLQEQKGKLNALSPVRILKSGYSITRTRADKQIITTAEQVSRGHQLEVILATGSLDVVVEGKTSHGQEDI